LVSFQLKSISEGDLAVAVSVVGAKSTLAAMRSVEQMSVTRPSASTVTTGATHWLSTSDAMFSSLPLASPVQPRIFLKAPLSFASTLSRQPWDDVPTGAPFAAALA